MHKGWAGSGIMYAHMCRQPGGQVAFLYHLENGGSNKDTIPSSRASSEADAISIQSEPSGSN